MTHVSLTPEAMTAIRYNFWKKHASQPSSELECRELVDVINGSGRIDVSPEALYSVYLKEAAPQMSVHNLEVLAGYFGFECWKCWLAENQHVITAVIVDDEAPSRENLEAILKTFCERVMVVSKAKNLSEARMAILEKKPDLVFLDIHLGPESGVDVLQWLPDPQAEIMFVTAYKDYNAKPIMERPYEYILKPVDLDMLSDAIERVRLRVFQN